MDPREKEINWAVIATETDADSDYRKLLERDQLLWAFPGPNNRYIAWTATSRLDGHKKYVGLK